MANDPGQAVTKLDEALTAIGEARALMSESTTFVGGRFNSSGFFDEPEHAVKVLRGRVQLQTGDSPVFGKG